MSDELEHVFIFIFKVMNNTVQLNDQLSMKITVIFKAILQNDSYYDHLQA
jgi:hypothetical protein